MYRVATHSKIRNHRIFQFKLQIGRSFHALIFDTAGLIVMAG